MQKSNTSSLREYSLKMYLKLKSYLFDDDYLSKETFPAAYIKHNYNIGVVGFYSLNNRSMDDLEVGYLRVFVGMYDSVVGQVGCDV